MGKKKFIDKKKSATFQLLARDSSDPIYSEDPENDRVFVRVDNNNVSISGLDDNHDEGSDYGSLDNDPNSIFADAPDDEDYDKFSRPSRAPMQPGQGPAGLPDHIRKEIIELGFPDDGYNYLIHLREIRNTGGGSAYYHNPKANLHDLRHDVKAYDASRVPVSKASDEAIPKKLYDVAEKTVNVRVQKVADDEIAKLLEEDESHFGSDIEDLEEDFVVQANLPDDSEECDIYVEKSLSSVSKLQEEELDESVPMALHGGVSQAAGSSTVEVNQSFADKPRVQRLLDQQFDMIERQEYGTDSDKDDYDDFLAEEDTSLAEKLQNVLKDKDVDDFELDGKYKAPADILHDKERIKDGKVVSSASDIVRKCVEYAEKYENADDDREVVIVEESSDESEIWDCETIVSTYSNLDNHPGRIGAPEFTRKKKLAEAVSGALKNGSDKVISLGGKERLPVDYLPHGRKATKEKVKAVSKAEQPKRKPHGEESKEEKKERKAVVKEERREARRLKKEMKGLYREEAKRAQKVAAVSGPSSIHLM